MKRIRKVFTSSDRPIWSSVFQSVLEVCVDKAGRLIGFVSRSQLGFLLTFTGRSVPVLAESRSTFPDCCRTVNQTSGSSLLTLSLVIWSAKTSVGLANQ